MGKRLPPPSKNQDSFQLSSAISRRITDDITGTTGIPFKAWQTSGLSQAASTDFADTGDDQGLHIGGRLLEALLPRSTGIGKINDLFHKSRLYRSEEGLAVNLTENHPKLAKFVFDQQQRVLI